MKTIIAAIAMLYASASMATVTLSWTPGDVVEGAAVSHWLVWCIPADRTYGAPDVRPVADELDHSIAFEWQDIDGPWKCKVQARSVEAGASANPVLPHVDSGDAADGSNEIFYEVKDRAVFIPEPPPPPLEAFPIAPGNMTIR